MHNIHNVIYESTSREKVINWFSLLQRDIFCSVQCLASIFSANKTFCISRRDCFGSAGCVPSLQVRCQIAYLVFASPSVRTSVGVISILKNYQTLSLVFASGVQHE